MQPAQWIIATCALGCREALAVGSTHECPWCRTTWKRCLLYMVPQASLSAHTALSQPGMWHASRHKGYKSVQVHRVVLSSMRHPSSSAASNGRTTVVVVCGHSCLPPWRVHSHAASSCHAARRGPSANAMCACMRGRRTPCRTLLQPIPVHIHIAFWRHFSLRAWQTSFTCSLAAVSVVVASGRPRGTDQLAAQAPN